MTNISCFKFLKDLTKALNEGWEHKREDDFFEVQYESRERCF